MKRSPRPRKTAELPRSLHQQLNMYALAAGAAGVGLLAAAPPADAKIIYTPAHRVITPKHSFNIDFNHDGITDFRIANSVSACTDFCFFELRQRPADGNSAVGYTIERGPRSPFKKGTAAMVVARSNVYTSNKTIVYGPWINVKDRYLGLKFQIKGNTHYGWARLNVKVGTTTITATLTGYAYETIPNKPIIAGQTKGQDDATVEESNTALTVPTPEPTTLGVLTLGSPGLSMWRREESAVAR